MSADDATTGPSPSSPDFDLQVSGIATLGDPLRRALYRSVISRTGPVNRDQVAEGAGVARHVVKFHLDRLADEGLLAVEYARPARELAVSLPQRDDQLARRLLARAVTDPEREGIAVGLALGRAARRTGGALGDRARRVAGAPPTPTNLLAAATGVLVECGDEPRTGGRSPRRFRTAAERDLAGSSKAAGRSR